MRACRFMHVLSCNSASRQAVHVYMYVSRDRLQPPCRCIGFEKLQAAVCAPSHVPENALHHNTFLALRVAHKNLAWRAPRQKP